MTHEVIYYCYHIQQILKQRLEKLSTFIQLACSGAWILMPKPLLLGTVLFCQVPKGDQHLLVAWPVMPYLGNVENMLGTGTFIGILKIFT